MGIDTIFFDIGGVLLNIDFLPLNRALEAKCPRLQKMDDKTSVQFWANYYDEGRVAEFERSFPVGGISSEEFLEGTVRFLSEDFGYTGTVDDFAEAIKRMLTGVNQDVLKCKDAAVMKGLKVGIISDTNAFHTAYMQERYAEIFAGLKRERVILSQEVGMRKGDGPEIFRLALERAKSRPEETVMLDDSEHKLVQARAAGLGTVKITRGMDLPAELAKLGVELAF